VRITNRLLWLCAGANLGMLPLVLIATPNDAWFTIACLTICLTVAIVSENRRSA
jgi:hypothetical protein